MQFSESMIKNFATKYIHAPKTAFKSADLAQNILVIKTTSNGHGSSSGTAGMKCSGMRSWLHQEHQYDHVRDPQ